MAAEHTTDDPAEELGEYRAAGKARRRGEPRRGWWTSQFILRMWLHLHTQSTLSPAVELETRRATANHFHRAKERRFENRERKERACVRNTLQIAYFRKQITFSLFYYAAALKEEEEEEEEEEKSNWIRGMQTLGVTSNPQSTLRTGRETASQACKQSTANKRPMNAATEQTKKPPNPKSKRDEAQRGAWVLNEDDRAIWWVKISWRNKTSRATKSRARNTFLRGDASISTRHRDTGRERERERESIRIGIFAGDAVVRKSTSFFLFAPSPQVPGLF